QVDTGHAAHIDGVEAKPGVCVEKLDGRIVICRLRIRIRFARIGLRLNGTSRRIRSRNGSLVQGGAPPIGAAPSATAQGHDEGKKEGYARPRGARSINND